jgi:hypothetical protein
MNTKQKLGEQVQFDVDGGKPARNPKSNFGFDLITPDGRKAGNKVRKAEEPEPKGFDDDDVCT